jgi:glycosyltransferase involved in cell wall biosynthesis
VLIKISSKNPEVKVLFVYSSFQSFVKKDIELLNKQFILKEIKWRGKRDIFKILSGVFQSDITYSWFASDHAFITVLLSKIFKKKSIVIVGGIDAANVPEINYGRFTQSYFKKKMTIYTLKHATKVLVVDPSLKEDIIKNAKVNGKNIEYVPTGYNPDYWKPKGKKENIVLTVGGIVDSVVKRKGFKTFVKAAEYISDSKFVIVGKHIDSSIDELKDISKNNVEFTGFVSDEELLRWYQKSKVYCQLSRYEGLPNALCEAMLCECIPVGTKNCGIPMAIGKTGFYVPYNAEEETADAISKALKNQNLGKKARVRIKSHFPISKREKKLVDIIMKITK